MPPYRGLKVEFDTGAITLPIAEPLSGSPVWSAVEERRRSSLNPAALGPMRASDLRSLVEQSDI